MYPFSFTAILFFAIIYVFFTLGFKIREDKTKCPRVKALRNFDLNEMFGTWYVVQYYATSEEEIIYKCMRAVFSMPTEGMEVEMNVTYSFIDDPDNDLLCGNITWRIPDSSQPAHWLHEEDTFQSLGYGHPLKYHYYSGRRNNFWKTKLDEGVYNTYILDSDNKEWSLLLHCAEKPKSPRYLTSLIMSRNTTLPAGVISYLRDKLPRYDIALEYMFPMQQTDCEDPTRNLHYALPVTKHHKHFSRKHPFRHRGRRSKANKHKEM